MLAHYPRPGRGNRATRVRSLGRARAFFAEGEATIRFGTVNTILTKDKALLISKGRPHVIAAQPGTRAKLLRMEVPARDMVGFQLIPLEH